MNKLNQKLMDLFRMSDGLLLPDESVLEEISVKQQDLESFGEKMVFQGFATMKIFLQELASQTEAGLFNFRDESNWLLNEESQSNRLKSHSNTPSLWELTRHLSNWMTVFVSPIRTLDIRGDVELIRCLESTDHHISILAAIMLDHEEFRYLGSIEKFNETPSTRRPTSLQLEICRLIYSRYGDWQPLRKEAVPMIISSDSEYDAIFENGEQRKKIPLIYKRIGGLGYRLKQQWTTSEMVRVVGLTGYPSNGYVHYDGSGTDVIRSLAVIFVATIIA